MTASLHWVPPLDLAVELYRQLIDGDEINVTHRPMCARESGIFARYLVEMAKLDRYIDPYVHFHKCRDCGSVTISMHHGGRFPR